MAHRICSARDDVLSSVRTHVQLYNQSRYISTTRLAKDHIHMDTSQEVAERLYKHEVLMEKKLA